MEKLEKKIDNDDTKKPKIDWNEVEEISQIINKYSNSLVLRRHAYFCEPCGPESTYSVKYR